MKGVKQCHAAMRFWPGWQPLLDEPHVPAEFRREYYRIVPDEINVSE